MRATILSLTLLGAGLLAGTQAASAQNAYSYAWCSITASEGIQSCYYTSKQQCETTLSGIAGICVPNPNYRPSGSPRR